MSSCRIDLGVPIQHDDFESIISFLQQQGGSLGQLSTTEAGHSLKVHVDETVSWRLTVEEGLLSFQASDVDLTQADLDKGL